MKSTSHVSNIVRYLGERFPIQGVLLFAATYAGFAIGMTGSHAGWRPFLAVVVAFSAFLLRLRVMDEFKDAEHDARNYPQRPFPAGNVSKGELGALGLLALSIEGAAVLWLGSGLLAYLPFLVFTLIVGKDFFIPRYLAAHFTLSFLLHELAFILYALFLIVALDVSSLYSLDVWLVLVLFPVGVEIVRKFKPRIGRQGTEVADNYSTVWGRGWAVVILLVIAVLMGGLVALRFSSWSIVLVAVVALVFMLAGYARKVDSLVLVAFVSLNLVLAMYCNL